MIGPVLGAVVAGIWWCIRRHVRYLWTRINKLQRQVETLTDEKVKLQHQSRQASLTHGELNRSIIGLKAILKKSRKKKQNLLQRLKQLRKEKETLRATSLSPDLKVLLENRVSELQRHLQDARRENEDLQERTRKAQALAGQRERVNELTEQLKVASLQALAECLGVTKKAKKKAVLSETILSVLKGPQTGTVTEREAKEPSSGGSKIARLAEIILALKSKADGPDAPHDEIEAELRSLEEQMDRDEAITVAKQIGVVRHLNSRNEAIEEIRRKVFEMKRARESIAY